MVEYPWLQSQVLPPQKKKERHFRKDGKVVSCREKSISQSLVQALEFGNTKKKRREVLWTLEGPKVRTEAHGENEQKKHFNEEGGEACGAFSLSWTHCVGTVQTSRDMKHRDYWQEASIERCNSRREQWCEGLHKLVVTAARANIPWERETG